MRETRRSAADVLAEIARLREVSARGELAGVLAAAADRRARWRRLCAVSDAYESAVWEAIARGCRAEARAHSAWMRDATSALPACRASLEGAEAKLQVCRERFCRLLRRRQGLDRARTAMVQRRSAELRRRADRQLEDLHAAAAGGRAAMEGPEI